MSTENETVAPQNDFIGGLAPSTAVTSADNSLSQAQQQAPDVGQGSVISTTEEVTYADGSSAAGTGPLPTASPTGSPMISVKGLGPLAMSAAQPSPYSQELDEEVPEYPFPPAVSRDSAQSEAGSQSVPKPDYQSLYAQEVLAHEQTKLQLKAAQKIVDNAKAMGFSGAGIHTGT